MRPQTQSGLIQVSRWVVLPLALVLGLPACATRNSNAPRDREILSRTRVTGFVNGAEVSGNISATIDTSRGGRSKCEYSKLPLGFNPGTFGTHA